MFIKNLHSHFLSFVGSSINWSETSITFWEENRKHLIFSRRETKSVLCATIVPVVYSWKPDPFVYRIKLIECFLFFAVNKPQSSSPMALTFSFIWSTMSPVLRLCLFIWGYRLHTFHNSHKPLSYMLFQTSITALWNPCCYFLPPIHL